MATEVRAAYQQLNAVNGGDIMDHCGGVTVYY